jgi:hypothetical protein
MTSNNGMTQAQRRAVRFLYDMLVNGPVPATEIQEAAEAAGVSWRLLNRVRPHAGAMTIKRGYQGPWYWQLDPTTHTRLLRRTQHDWPHQPKPPKPPANSH